MYRTRETLRRSSRRSQVSAETSNYKEVESSDFEDGEIPGSLSNAGRTSGDPGVIEEDTRFKKGGWPPKNGDKGAKVNWDKTTGKNSSRGVQHNYTWSLQSEEMRDRLKSLFREEEEFRGGNGTKGAPFLSTDVTLVSEEGDCVAVHKMILVLCCPYFWNLFTKIPTPLEKDTAKSTLVVMGNVKTKCLKKLVRFIYMGTVDVTLEEEQDFLKMGEVLGISGIRSGGKATPAPTVSRKTPAVTNSNRKSRGNGVVEDDHDSGVIKVHVIDKRKPDKGQEGEDQPELDDLEDPDALSVCKLEPLAEEFCQLPDDFDDDFCDDNDDRTDDPVSSADPAGNSDSVYKSTARDDKANSDPDYDNDQDDDDGSICAGDRDGEDGDFEESIGKRQKITKKHKSTKTLVRRGIQYVKYDWFVINPPAKDHIEKNYRVLSHHKGVNYESWVYYCSHGVSPKKCKARLRCLITDGITTYYTNNEEHSAHRTHMYGLPQETKQFIISMMEKGQRRPERILKAMKNHKLKVSSKKQVENFIMYTIKKSGKVFPFAKSTSSEMPPKKKRVTKPKTEGTTPAKKRGRPFKNPNHSKEAGAIPPPVSAVSLPNPVSSQGDPSRTSTEGAYPSSSQAGLDSSSLVPSSREEPNF